MKVLLTGANGQLGLSLRALKPNSIQLDTLARKELDITDTPALRKAIIEMKPDLIINAAAYTAVDKAEEEQELAFKINGHAVGDIARLAKDQDIRLIHISTDYVFDGNSSIPYKENDTPNPINIYGESKLFGEERIINISPRDFLILRTAWIYSIHATGFVTKMVDLLKNKEHINVVNDQIGTPTSALSLAQVIYTSIEEGLSGIYNYTDGGVASWYDFASSIRERILKMRLIKKAAEISPVTSDEYNSLAKRPLYSVLDKTKIAKKINFQRKHWTDILDEELNSLRQL